MKATRSGCSTTSRPGRSTTSSISATATDFHLVVDSVLHWSVVNELVYKCDVVYHLAAAVGVRLIVEQPVQTLVTNLRGTEIVLEHCHRFGKRVLVASTSEVYGDHREERPLDETDRRIYGPTTQKRWAYADSKAMDEFLALAHHSEHDLDCVIVRLFNTVGPRQSGQYGMVIPTFVQRALAGEPIEIHGDGDQTRCFCHVADTIRALAGLMDARDFGRDLQRRLGGAHLDQRARASRVQELTSSSSAIEYVAYDDVYGIGIEDMLHRIPSTAKIRAATGWAPERTLDDILGDVLAFERCRVEPRPSAGAASGRLGLRAARRQRCVEARARTGGEELARPEPPSGGAKWKP